MMARYSVTGAVHASTYIGEYDANTPEEAIERAYRDAGVSLCHECAREVSDPEVCELVAEDVETGDATSEATTNDQIVEQAAEIIRLRIALEDVREWAKHDHVMRFDDGDVPLADYCTQVLDIAKAKGEAT